MKPTLILARAAAAAGALVALVVGAPVLLTRFGNPTRTVIDAFSDELASDTSKVEALLTGFLVAIGWVAWVMVVAAVLVEIVSALRGRMSRRIPVLPGIQTMARSLVTAVTLVGTIATTSQAAAAPLILVNETTIAEPLSHDTSPSVSAPMADANADALGPTYRVVRSDTWWSIAERLLGSGHRWQELVDVNLRRTMADGQVIDSSTTRPLPGWTIALPDDAVLPLEATALEDDVVREAVQHEVVAGDTLWDIAGRYLPATASTETIVDAVAELADANRDRIQVDGRNLTDPNLIEPGWVLTIPDSMTGRRPTVAAHEVTVESGDTLWDLAEEHLGSGERYPEIVEANLGVAQPDGEALIDADRIEPGWVLDLRSDDEGAPTGGADEPSVVDPRTTDSEAPPTSVPVDRRPSDEARSDEVHELRPESSVPAPPAAALPPVPPATSAAPGLDDADVSEDGGVPIPVGLLAGGVVTAGVVAVLNRRRRVQRQRRRPGHVLPEQSPAEELAEISLRAGADVPRSELVAVALQAAAAGAGDAGVPPVRYVAVSDEEARLHLHEQRPAPPGFRADGSTWITTSAFSELEELAQGGIDPLPLLCSLGTTPDGLEEILVDLEQAGVVNVAGPDDRVVSLLRSMTLSLSTAMWATAPQVLAIGMSGDIDQLDWVRTPSTLVEGLETARRHIAGGGAQGDGAGTRLDAWDPLAVVSIKEPWEVHQPLLAELARSAPIGSAVIVPHASADPDGAVVTIHEDGRLDYPGVDIDVIACGLSHDDVRVVGELLERAGELDQDVPAETGQPPRGVREVLTLADELQDIDVLVRVMGDVTVERVGDDSSAVTFERTRSQEAVVYLAAREEGRGVAIEDLRAALWPDGRAVDQTVRNTISRARAGLGEDTDGIPYLPTATEGRYHLSDRVVTDFEMFWSMRQAANEIDDVAVSAEMLDQALELVRGEPFLGPGRGYAWTSSLGTTIVVAVVDVAHELGCARLAASDLSGAERAARAGLTIAPGEERLYRVLMRAAAARDSKPMIERVYRELLDVLADPDLGIEPEATVSAETVALFNELMGRRSRQTA